MEEKEKQLNRPDSSIIMENRRHMEEIYQQKLKV